MQRVELNGVEVEYELTGDGEPVVLLHARPFVLWYLPLIEVLRDARVLRYRREAPTTRPWSVEDDARLCTSLLAHVGMDRPHVVGHSYGGIVALELARQNASALRSTALFEPAPVGLLAPDEAEHRAGPLAATARADGPGIAMDRFLRAVCDNDGPEALDELVPGALADGFAHAAGFFAVELPALARWSFGPSDAARIDIPLLNLRGTRSAPRFAEGAALLEAWFPAAEHRVLDGANHFLMAQAPDASAELLDRFWR